MFSVQSLLSCLVAVVCLAEINLSCFDQVFTHQLYHPWGPVHTNAFSFENANILLRLYVPFTRKRCIVFDETQTFENALQSGKIWKRNSIGFVWTRNANFWKRLIMWSQSEHIQRERIDDFFIGISLLLSLIVNWQFNFYAHKFK